MFPAAGFQLRFSFVLSGVDSRLKAVRPQHGEKAAVVKIARMFHSSLEGVATLGREVTPISTFCGLTWQVIELKSYQCHLSTR